MSQRTLQMRSYRADRHRDADRLVAVLSLVRMGMEDGNEDGAADALIALGVTPDEISVAEHTYDREATPDWPW